MIPCFVITRDRVSYTRLCVESLERFSDQLEIHLVDHGSTWPAMLDYLDTSSHPVHRSPSRPPRSLWGSEELTRVAGTGRYLVTDPDLVLDPDCPSDWLQRLDDELDYRAAIKQLVKVGLSLRLDDLPPSSLTDAVCAWECGFWVERTDSGQAWKAPVDTTLALYPPLQMQQEFLLTPAARLDAPYLLRHLPWYGESGPEIQYYREHLVPGSSHWIGGGWH